ncbi:hypothetical protein FMEXI_7656 [Fusarium mexicanum]|uniref:Uncharacterized protein n=1 Tax=Fusarium mexicanum TaxID=751941 RepID=A0A8H5ITY0_9HYPO|nr:hypothetical protein FMEXI_7656 [Fusarium mexicanum]
MEKAPFSPSPTDTRSVRVWTNMSDPKIPNGLYGLAAQANRPLILNIVLRSHEYDHDFETQLLGCFPKFPIHLLADIYESSTWGRGTVILPNTTDERCEFWSLERRQDHLAKYEQRAFLDVTATFSGWPTIWTNARRELAQRHASMYSSANAVADLGTTRIIHQDMANVIALCEDLRLLNVTYAKYSQILNVPNSKMARINKLRTLSGRRREQGQPIDEAKLKERTELVELENRLQDCQQNLKHQLETSEVNLRQLENLLSLVGCVVVAIQNEL